MKLARANDAIHKEGFALEAEVKESIAGRKAERTSVDTGRFLNSVRTDNSKALMSVVKTDLDYPKFLEHGTSKIKARKHFAHSAARRKEPIRKNILRAVS